MKEFESLNKRMRENYVLITDALETMIETQGKKEVKRMEFFSFQGISEINCYITNYDSETGELNIIADEYDGKSSKAKFGISYSSESEYKIKIFDGCEGIFNEGEEFSFDKIKGKLARMDLRSKKDGELRRYYNNLNRFISGIDVASEMLYADKLELINKFLETPDNFKYQG